MSAIKTPTPLVTDDAVAAGQISHNCLLLDRRTSYANGTLGKGVLGFIGDSMAGNAIINSTYSPISTARMLDHDFDLVIDGRDYFYKDGPNVGQKRPDGQRGYNFARGGTDIAYMRDVQLPYIKEAPPEFAFLSCFQNNSFSAVGSAAAAVTLVTGVIEHILDLGTTIVMAGMWPHDEVGSGNEEAYGKHWVEHAMRNWCERKQGIRYVPTLDLMKADDIVAEQGGVLNWKPGYTAPTDGIHYLPLASRAMYRRFGTAFREIVPRRATTPTYDGAVFAETRNPYGNYFGPAGMLVGSGGKINGATSADMPVGWELLYDTTKGYTVTPTLTGNRDWPLRLSYSGTPTGDDTIILRVASNARLFPGQPMEIHGRMRWVAMEGLAAVGLGESLLYKNGRPIVSLPGAGGTGERVYVMPFPLTEEVTLRSARPAGFANEYGQQVDLDFQHSVYAGVRLAGAGEYGRAGMFRNDNTVPENV